MKKVKSKGLLKLENSYLMDTLGRFNQVYNYEIRTRYENKADMLFCIIADCVSSNIRPDYTKFFVYFSDISKRLSEIYEYIDEDYSVNEEISEDIINDVKNVLYQIKIHPTVNCTSCGKNITSKVKKLIVAFVFHREETLCFCEKCYSNIDERFDPEKSEHLTYLRK